MVSCAEGLRVAVEGQGIPVFVISKQVRIQRTVGTTSRRETLNYHALAGWIFSSAVASDLSTLPTSIAKRSAYSNAQHKPHHFSVS